MAFDLSKIDPSHILSVLTNPELRKDAQDEIAALKTLAADFKTVLADIQHCAEEVRKIQADLAAIPTAPAAAPPAEPPRSRPPSSDVVPGRGRRPVRRGVTSYLQTFTTRTKADASSRRRVGEGPRGGPRLGRLKWWAANETALAVMQSGVVYTIVKPDNSIAHVIKQGRDVKVLKAQIIKV